MPYWEVNQFKNAAEYKTTDGDRGDITLPDLVASLIYNQENKHLMV